MVELYEDRCQRHGQVIAGDEKGEWTSLKEQLNLIDMGIIGEFSWQNYGKGHLLRKAKQGEQYIRTKCRISYRTNLSDHYPIIAKVDNEEYKTKNKWFHTNSSLFKLHMVQEEIK